MCDSRLVEWVRTWLFTTWRTDQLAKIEKVAATAGELRALITEARADPLVRRWRHDSRHELVGDKPTHCACGQEYRTAGSMPTPHDWLPCRCGGHFWWGCRQCPAERVEPPLAYDCRPRMPGR